jgi:hypothetical protein
MDTNVQFYSCLLVCIRGYQQNILQLDGSVTDSVGAIGLDFH